MREVDANGKKRAWSFLLSWIDRWRNEVAVPSGGAAIGTPAAPIAASRGAAPLRRALAAGSGFLRSRRWLIGALAVTGMFLGLVLAARSKRDVPEYVPSDPAVVFDDIKTFPARAAGSRSRATPGDESRTVEVNRKLGRRSAGPTLDNPLAEDEPPAPMRLSRRLDAVRWRQARGAWLSGTIEEIADATPRRSPDVHTSASRRDKAQLAPERHRPDEAGLKTIEQTAARALR